MSSAKRILVAPLDWGLGHAARCLPVVRALLERGAEPVLASHGRALALLRAEFPELPWTTLPPYGIRYPSDNMTLNIGAQLPRLVRAVWREHRQLPRVLAEFGIGAVFSDNRYGCFSSQARCVLLTHQVHLRIRPVIFGKIANAANHYFIRRFDECWIPDLAAAPGLAGALSHPPPAGARVRYVGWLSHLHKVPPLDEYDLLLLLSGPEPQRSRLEKLLLGQVGRLSLRTLLVRGVTEKQERRRLNGRVEAVNYLTSSELSRALAGSRLVVCRPGYSTLMDLARLGKPAILIPTPGQTEQEYLAERLFAGGLCYREPQAGFDLERALLRSEEYRGLSGFPETGAGLLERAVDVLVEW